MFANIRRHQKWLLYIISAAVIISMIMFLNPNQGNGGGGGMFSTHVGSINGRQIGRSEFLDTQKDAHLKYLFTYGSWYGSDEFSRQNEGFIDRETRQRIFLREKARELGIHVTPENVADWIQEQFGREKPFTEADYNNLLKNLSERGVTEADLNRYVRAEVATMHLAQVAGTSGRLVTPQEAEAQYRRENQQISAEAVFFGASNFLAKVNMDAANIAKHYTNQQQNFRVPDTIQISYVAFSATNYYAAADKVLAGVTNLNQMIDQMYLQRGTNYYTDPAGAPMTPEAAKAKIREDERQQIALREARKEATDFAEALLAATNAPAGQPKAALLDQLAKQKNLAVQTTEPFGQYEIPSGMDVPEKFNQLAFSLTPEAPFAEEPIVGGEAVYIVALNKRIPSHVPPFAQLQDKVTDDYKRIESQRLAREAGQAFYAKLSAELAAGKAFNAVAFEGGLTTTTLAPFSMASRTIAGLDPRIDPSQVKNTAFSLKEGATSQFIATRDGGYILRVNKILPLSDSDVKSALPAYMATLQRSGQAEAFSEWFSKEFQQSKLALVTDKDEPAAPTSSAQ